MPIPIIIGAVAAAAAGALGIGGHLSAKETNDKAKKRYDEAQRIYYDAKGTLEKAQNSTEKSLLKLGYDKKRVLDTSITQFLNAYDKVKHIRVENTIGMDEIAKFTIDQKDEIELKKLTDIYSSSIKSGATGAAAGAVIALAANGGLAVVTSELGVAGSVFAMGEFSAAAGIVGSALSFGAAITPLAAIAAPVILFTGISASIKADENLEKAETAYAEAMAASEKMKNSEILCDAITKRADMFDDLLNRLDGMFAPCTGLLEGLVRKKEGIFFKKKITSDDFTKDELELISVTRALAGAVKNIINTPMLSEDGTPSNESENIYNDMSLKLPRLIEKANEVKQINYNVKPISPEKSKILNMNLLDLSQKVVWLNFRNIIACVIGFVLSIICSGFISKVITKGKYKFLFLNAYNANKIAIWMLLAVTVIMFVGKFKNTVIEKISKWIVCISMFILYVQFCRNVERMTHYIIFTLVVGFLAFKLFEYLSDVDNKNSFIDIILLEILCIIMWAVAFLVYSFAAEIIHARTFWLVVTSILLLIASLIGMKILDDSY